MADARAIVAKYGVDLPPSRRRAARRSRQRDAEAGRSDLRQRRIPHRCPPARGLDAATRRRPRRGLRVVDLGADLEGEARDVAARHAGLARELRRDGRRVRDPVGRRAHRDASAATGAAAPIRNSRWRSRSRSTAQRGIVASPATPTGPMAAAARPTTRPARSSTRRRWRGRAAARGGSARRSLADNDFDRLLRSRSAICSARPDADQRQRPPRDPDRLTSPFG